MARRTLQIISFASSVLVVAQYGEARTLPRDNGPRDWVWGSGVEEGNFHPVDSAVDSQASGVSRFPIHEVLRISGRGKKELQS
jgi:hypothetical protein